MLETSSSIMVLWKNTAKLTFKDLPLSRSNLQITTQRTVNENVRWFFSQLGHVMLLLQLQITVM